MLAPNGIFGLMIGGFIFGDYAVAPDSQSFVMFPDYVDREEETA